MPFLGLIFIKNINAKGCRRNVRLLFYIDFDFIAYQAEGPSSGVIFFRHLIKYFSLEYF